MPDPRGFLGMPRSSAPMRPVQERTADWSEVYEALARGERKSGACEQASRCMDCGIPYCHSESVGCPLGNLIPEWNDLVRRGDWALAADRLHETNNFPEFTGRLCPAPCETACVLALSEARTTGSVAIKRVEQAIADTAWDEGFVVNRIPAERSGRTVAIVGSGPAGLAAAQQLTRVGHRVTVFERDDRPGGLLRYGIPDFKLAKSAIDRRLSQLCGEGTRFVTDCDVGLDLDARELTAVYDAVILAIGAGRSRDVDVPGRVLGGIHFAMDYLVPANRECAGDGPSPINASGKNVVIIGGGDTAADCLGTVHRQGAASVTELNYHEQPPRTRDSAADPWPLWPLTLRAAPADAEGGRREFEVAAQEFVGDGHVRAVKVSPVRVSAKSEGRQTVERSGESFELPCDLVLLAVGFAGVGESVLLAGLGVEPNLRGVIACGQDWQTSQSGVFVCGDAHRGASLVVWAIAEGRSAARAVDVYLTGASTLPEPVHPGALPLGIRRRI
ncbi:glutamate synthase subunit beta [Rhodococcus sp. OK302]|uniref:glutamate synthase subunit beta n=1 Tax=Rhodococcus sp. OK302 TaxID=1882769 RepID=UPI000B93B651|nr:glutamate synthase subunit beta [Rhodococcus sp. OK302]